MVRLPQRGLSSQSLGKLLYPRYLPFILLRHLHPTHWSWWKSEASFCAPLVPMHVIYEDRIWQMQFPSCCTQNMELFTATSPFAKHQLTTVPVWAQNSSLQTRLHMILPPRTIEEWTYLLTSNDNLTRTTKRENTYQLKLAIHKKGIPNKQQYN